MTHLKATDQQQIAVFRRIVTMLQAQLNHIDTQTQRRDVSVALGDYAEILASDGGEIGEKLLEQMVDADDINAQIVFCIQSMRRVCVSAMRDIGNIKKEAMIGVAPPETVPPAETPPTESPPEAEPDVELEDDELAEDLELTEEQ